MISGDQVRAARALLDWKQSDLAEKTGLSIPSINAIEHSIGSPRLGTLHLVQEALQTAGIEFLDSDGVRKHREYFEMREFQGEGFIRKLNDDLFACMRSPEDELLIYGLQDKKYTEHDPQQTLRYHEHQTQTGFKERSLLREGDDFFLSPTEGYRWISSKLLGVISYYVYHDRVVLIMWRTRRTIIIRSQEVADTFRAQFEYLWDMAKPVPPGSKALLDDPNYREKLSKKNKKSRD